MLGDEIKTSQVRPGNLAKNWRDVTFVPLVRASQSEEKTLLDLHLMADFLVNSYASFA